MIATTRVRPAFVRRALAAAAACALLLSAGGCACRCTGGTDTSSRSLAFTLDSIGARFCEDAKNTADAITGIPCAFKSHVDDCAQSLCETQQLMGGCYGKTDR